MADTINLKTSRRPDGWWVVGVPDTIEEIGPYDTKREADEARRGQEHFWNVEIHRKPKEN